MASPYQYHACGFCRDKVALPDGLEYWTADEVAECLSVGDDLYKKLWKLLASASKKTPLGGDGSNGTVEEPAGRLDLDNDDKMWFLWTKLTCGERYLVSESYRKYAR
jgi:hypothetical protein